MDSDRKGPLINNSYPSILLFISDLPPQNQGWNNAPNGQYHPPNQGYNNQPYSNQGYNPNPIYNYPPQNQGIFITDPRIQ